MTDGHSLTGKLALITGGDSGLGYAIAEALAKQGATVILAGHSQNKSDVAAGTLRHQGSMAYGIALDLGSFQSVRDFASKFLSKFTQPLDFLINDAGISGMSGSDYVTADGFEAVFQINYLGHFLLTELLLSSLRNSGSARIINVASSAHEWACSQAGLPEGCAKDWTYFPPPTMTGNNHFLQKKSLYGFSKLLMIEHAAQLAENEKQHGIKAFSLCPGFVATNMTNHGMSQIAMCVFMWGMHLFGKSVKQSTCPYTAQQGAAVIAFTALDDDARSGGFFTRYSGCQEAIVEPHGFAVAMRPELYERSLQLVGLNKKATNTMV